MVRTMVGTEPTTVSGWFSWLQGGRRPVRWWGRGERTVEGGGQQDGGRGEKMMVGFDEGGGQQDGDKR